MTAVVFAAGLAAGCASDSTADSLEGATPAPSALSPGLRVGDDGPEVEKLHAYLYEYGYFPNAAIRQRHPGWRPVVAEEPQSRALFDLHTRDAVRAFQRNANLLETGVADEDTVAAMSQPRCGVPESADKTSDKWAAFGRQWDTQSLTYSLDNTGVPEGRGSAVVNQVNAATAAWSSRSGYSLSSVSSNGKIKIKWADLGKDSAGNTILGSAGPVLNSSGTVVGYNITFTNNAGLKWTFGDNPLNSDIMDYYTVLLHELGHALGLDHSSGSYAGACNTNPCGGGTPVMFFSTPKGVARNIISDDLQGIHAVQPGHFGIDAADGSGTGTSITAGDDGTIWITGGSADSNGYRIYSRDFTNGIWTEHPFGGRAVQVAVADGGGGVWHINTAGNLYRQGASGWLKKSNLLASVIAAAGNEVWHLSKAVTRGTKDHDIYHWNGSGWDQVSGFASDIAVTRIGGQLQVWYTNEFGEVYRQIPGQNAQQMSQPPGGACGISAGADGAVFALQCPYNANGMPIFVFNQQTGTDRPGTGSDTPARNDVWTRVQGEARDVTSTLPRFGNPATLSVIYHIGTNGIYRSE